MDGQAAPIWAFAALAAAAALSLVANVQLWRELQDVKRLCMNAWIRLDDKQQAQNADRKERDQLIRRLARAEAAMDGLRAIAQESAMLAQLDEANARCEAARVEAAALAERIEQVWGKRKWIALKKEIGVLAKALSGKRG